MKTGIIIAVTVLLFTACKEVNDTQESSVVKTTETYSNVVAADAPANPANTYDSIGYWHNEAIRYIRECVPPSGDPDVRAIMKAMSDFKRYPFVAVDKVPYLINAVSKDRENKFRNLIRQSSYSDKAKLYLESLFRQIEDTQVIDYPLIKSEITRFEQTVHMDNQLSTSEKQAILTCTSVARYSSYYWSNGEEPPVSGKRLMWWIAVVTSDIAGGLFGGIDGAVSNSSYYGDLVTYALP